MRLIAGFPLSAPLVSPSPAIYGRYGNLSREGGREGKLTFRCPELAFTDDQKKKKNRPGSPVAMIFWEDPNPKIVWSARPPGIQGSRRPIINGISCRLYVKYLGWPGLPNTSATRKSIRYPKIALDK